MLKVSSDLKTNSVAFFEAAIGNYIAGSPNNALPSFPGEHIWDEPAVAFARGDAPLFQDYKKIIGDFHFTPREALEAHIKRSAYGYQPKKGERHHLVAPSLFA